MEGSLLNRDGLGVCVQDLYTSESMNVTTVDMDTAVFKEVTVPLIDFRQRWLERSDLLAGFSGTAEPNDTVLILNNIKWVNL